VQHYRLYVIGEDGHAHHTTNLCEEAVSASWPANENVVLLLQNSSIQIDFNHKLPLPVGLRSIQASSASVCAGGFPPRSYSINDSAKLAPLNPAAFWPARRVVPSWGQRRASGHPIK